MKSCKLLFSIVFFGLSSGTAGLAAPVHFTYTGTAVDLSVLEDWEYDYMVSGEANWDTVLPGLRPELTLKLDCDVQGGQLSCPTIASSTYLSLGDAPSGDGVLRLTEISGFTEPRVRVDRFEVGADGEVLDWFIEGLEYNAFGDFRLSSEGDSWAYQGWQNNAEFYYCFLSQNSDYDWTAAQCANGAAVDTRLTIDLGRGNWEVDLSQVDLVTAPLPAGWVLVASGLGVLSLQRRRRTARRAQT